MYQYTKFKENGQRLNLAEMKNSLHIAKDINRCLHGISPANTCALCNPIRREVKK
jgi:hypothetical protein